MPTRKTTPLPALEALDRQATISFSQFCEILDIRKETGSRMAAKGVLPVEPIQVGRLKRFSSARVRKVIGRD